jgi:geranylgeranyl diphosphate synthase type I
MKSLLPHKSIISTYLETYLHGRKEQSATVLLGSPNPYDKLTDFVLGGKMVRGSLCIAISQLTHDNVSEQVIKTAAALELFHAALLIHDDIMDESLTRHSKPTIHEQYREWAEEHSLLRPHRFAESMAQCVGDIAIFLGLDLLSDAAVPEVVRQLTSATLAATGVAQMQDVYFGVSRGMITGESIINMYNYKTAQYTFCLPFSLGASFANFTEKTKQDLQKIGTLLGIIFQLKDDELGLFGDAKLMGKPIGDDIRTGKKTLYYAHLFEKALPQEKQKLYTIFSNQNANNDEIEYVQKLVRIYGIDKLVDAEIQKYTLKIQEEIVRLELSDNKKELFEELLNFSLTRQK